MKKFALTYFVCCGMLSPILHAQQTTQGLRPNPPSDPLLEKAPDFAQWTVTVKRSGTPPVAKNTDNASPAPSATSAVHGEKPKAEPPDYQTVVVKTKQIRYEQTSSAGGRKIVSWYLPDLQITTEGSGTPAVTFTGNRNAVDYSRADFLGFEWISQRNYEGVQKVAGQDCLVFRDPLKVDGRVVKSDPQLMMVACIAQESRLPVALQLGDEVRTFAFGQPPATPLILPSDVEELTAQWRKSIRQSSRPVAKP